jgi:hypothetical protein
MPEFNIPVQLTINGNYEKVKWDTLAAAGNTLL